MKKASFLEADLTRAAIREAAFEQTDLRGANLTGWSLRRDELKGTIMDRRQVELLVQDRLTARQVGLRRRPFSRQVFVGKSVAKSGTLVATTFCSSMNSAS